MACADGVAGPQRDAVRAERGVRNIIPGSISTKKQLARGPCVFLGTRKSGHIVEIERHIITVDIDFDDAIDRFPKLGQLIDCSAGKRLLHGTVDVRNDNDQAGVKRLRPVEPAEIAGVVGDQHKVAFGGVAQDVPVLPPGHADMGNVLSLIASQAGD